MFSVLLIKNKFANVSNPTMHFPFGIKNNKSQFASEFEMYKNSFSQDVNIPFLNKQKYRLQKILLKLKPIYLSLNQSSKLFARNQNICRGVFEPIMKSRVTTSSFYFWKGSSDLWVHARGIYRFWERKRYRHVRG